MQQQVQQGMTEREPAYRCKECGFVHVASPKCLATVPIIREMFVKIMRYAHELAAPDVSSAHVELHYHVDKVDVNIKHNNVTFRS